VDKWFKSMEKGARKIIGDPDSPPGLKDKKRLTLFAVHQYKSYKLAAGKTSKSILISCAARLAVFALPKVRDLLSRDEMEFDKIGYEKTALFVIIPDTDKTFLRADRAFCNAG
jgi:type IV secretory pathway TraG/TraD family ATPase VirD4